MQYQVLWIRKKDNARRQETLTENELIKIVGDYVLSRVDEFGQTTTNVVNGGQTYKLMIAKIKN